MSNLYNWAENECRLVCKKINPDIEFDDDKFDYTNDCYKSALKAFKSLCEDDHSGYSFNATKNILVKLMNGLPLTPITDKDFPKSTEYDPNDAWLKQINCKSDIQCPRMSSLFRREHMDGTITYHDVDRSYFIDIEHPSDTYSSWDGFIDEMFPITMPYSPTLGKYKIYAQTFLTDKKHGDFDTKGILYVVTPEGKRVDLNIYKTEGDNGEWKTISKEEYEELLTKRVDKLNEKVAGYLIWTLISNSSSDSEIDNREKSFRMLSETTKNAIYDELDKLCEFYDNPDHYKYNTFDMAQALCTGEDKELYEDVPELVEIADFLADLLAKLP